MADRKRRSLPLLNSVSTFLHSKWSWFALTVILVSALAITIPSDPDSPQISGIKSQEQSAMGQGDVPAKIALSPDQTHKEYVSPVFKANYEFNAVAPHWKEANTEDGSRKVEMRTSPDGRNWSGWLEVEAIGPLRDDDPHPDRTFTENPLFVTGKHFQYRLSLTRRDTATSSPEISDLKVAYIDSRGSSAQRFVKKLASLKSHFSSPTVSAADQGPGIISRAEWGSPDPYGGYFKDTEKDWPPEASPVKQVFIHHTVNSNAQSDPKAVMRGIWEFHANTRGWGDIGYNFIIDGNGAIYEGRFGGDNTVGGHVLGYNKGSLGVAIIGCYDKDNSTCNQLNGGATRAPTNSVLHGLTEILAWKTTNFEINPKGTQAFCDSGGGSCLSLNNIAGHKDANQTSCPGDLLYNLLPFIRDETNRKKNLYAYGYSAKQDTYQAAILTSSDTATHTYRFKNTGTATWNNTTNHLWLKTANPNGRSSAFQGSGWLDNTTPANLNETSVPPGATGSFTFNLKRPANAFGNFYEGLRLISELNGELKAHFTLPIAGPVFSSVQVSQSAYPSILQGQQVAAFIAFRNTSNTAWYDDTSLGSAPSGTRPVHLATSREVNRSSVFGSSWGGDQNRPAINFGAVYESDGVTLAANQHIVQPGQIARFDFALSAPSNLAAGTYREFFRPIVESGTIMNDPWTFLDITVEPPRFTAAHKRQSPYPDLIANNVPQTTWIEFHNTGNQPWYDDMSIGGAPAGSKPVHLATAREINRNSFFGSSWGGGQNRPAVNFAAVYKSDGSVYATNPHVVQPGESARFEFSVSAPFGLGTGTYREFFQPIVEGGTIMNDTWAHSNIQVTAASYSSHQTSQCPYPALGIGGAPQACFIAFRNTSNTAWYDDTSLGSAPSGTRPVHLATSREVNRSSVFGSSWGGDQNRPAINFGAVYESDGVTLAANQHIVQPGQIARFDFALSAPSNLAAGTYREFFRPIVESGTIMNDPWTFLDITAQ